MATRERPSSEDLDTASRQLPGALPRLHPVALTWLERLPLVYRRQSTR